MYSFLDVLDEMCEEDRIIIDILRREYVLDYEEALEKFENKYGLDIIQSDAKNTLEVFYEWVRRGFWEGNTNYIHDMVSTEGYNYNLYLRFIEEGGEIIHVKDDLYLILLY